MITIKKVAELVHDLTGSEIPHNDLVLSHLRLVQHQDHTETELKEEMQRALNYLDQKENIICSECYWDKITSNIENQSDLLFWLDNTKALNLITGEFLYKQNKEIKEDQKIKCSVCQRTQTQKKESFNDYYVLTTNAQKEDIDIIDLEIETAKNPTLQSQIENISRDQTNEDLNAQGTKFIPISPRKSGKPYRILSHGMGKDSMTEYILNWRSYDLIIFSDTGNEQNETYAYLEYLVKLMPIEARARFIIISSNYLGNIYDYFYNKKIIPMPWRNRDCTDKFKVRPIRHFLRGRQSDPAKGGIFNKKCVFEMAIGINYSEITRVAGTPQKEDPRLYSTDVKYIFNSYPLVEQKIRREDEKSILLKAGILVPVKSGCKICPFTTKKGFSKLKISDPKGYQQVIDLMKNSTADKDIYKLIESDGLDKFMEFQNKETVNNRCSCMNGNWSEEDETEDETMVKTNKW